MPRIVARGLRPPAGKALGAAGDPGIAAVPRGDVALDDLVSLAQVLRTEAEMPVVSQRRGKVDVERGLRRGQRTVVDVRGAVAEIVPEGEIDRFEGAVGHAVGAPRGAEYTALAAVAIARHHHEEALVPLLAAPARQMTQCGK